jgi:hypothetical protein
MRGIFPYSAFQKTSNRSTSDPLALRNPEKVLLLQGGAQVGMQESVKQMLAGFASHG